MSTAKTEAVILLNDSTTPAPFDVQQILSITVSKEVNKVPTARLMIKDGSANKQDFPISNQGLFKPGVPIEIQLGTPNKKETVFRGIIVKHGLKVRKDKPSILLIECKDKAIKLTVGRRGRYFTNNTKEKDLSNTDEVIFKEILEKYKKEGITAHVEPLEKGKEIIHTQITQFYSTDWDFLALRAEAIGQYLFVDDNTINIQKPKLSAASVGTLIYGASGDEEGSTRIWDFESEMNACYQFESVQTWGWDYAKQKVTAGKSSFSVPQEPGNIPSDELEGVLNTSTFELHQMAQLEEKELNAIADAVKQKSLLNKVYGRIKFDGKGNIKPGDMVTLAGVGDRFNGEVFVSRIHHTFEPGRWFTHAQFGLPYRWFYEENRIQNPPAQGLLPTIKGLQVGTVIQLKDEQQPDKNFRIKVSIPGLHEKNEGIWARLATNYAGPEYGMVFLPEIKDEVVLAYVGQDARAPVILGIVHSETRKPPLENTDKNYHKGIVTKGQNKVLFDDENNILTVETKAGNTMILDDNAKKITLKDVNDNEIIMEGNGITISNNAMITIKGKSVSIEATTIDLKGTTATMINSPSGGQVRMGSGLIPVAGVGDQLTVGGIPAAGIIGPPPLKNAKVFI